MGSPLGYSTFNAHMRAQCEDHVIEATSANNEDRFEEWFSAWYTDCEKCLWATITPDSSAGIRFRQHKYWHDLLLQAAISEQQQPGGGVYHLEQSVIPHNEHWHRVPVAEFQLARVETLNAWYRLYDPSHGIPQWGFSYSERYSARITEKDQMFALAQCYGDHVSGTPLTCDDQIYPVFLVSYFDAVIFAKWLYWNGRSCRLPTEAEWEYAAKFGTDPRDPFWWGPEEDLTGMKSTHDNQLGGVLPPFRSHANPATREIDPQGIGVMDMLGNVWEWCVDQYFDQHRDQSSEIWDPSLRRVLRGGAADKRPRDLRSARRNSGSPNAPGQKIGFRLARDARVVIQHDEDKSAARSGDVILHIRNIGFRQNQREWLFQGVEFNIQKGDRLGLVGPSGAGKSTLLKVLACLMSTDEGAIDLTTPVDCLTEQRALIHYLPQQAAFLAGTVEANLKEPFTYGVNIRRQKRFSIDYAVELFQRLGRTSGFLARDAEKLSSGERQIVSLVRALLIDPTIILLDEETSHMDPETTIAAYELVNEWVSTRNRGIIRVSHDISSLRRMSHEVFELRNGRLTVFNEQE
jgi:putative ABC transport system ATP-binding protein